MIEKAYMDSPLQVPPLWDLSRKHFRLRTIDGRYIKLNKARAIKTLNLIENCECKEGCPSCIYSPKCGNENKPLDKKAATIILKHLVSACS